MAAITRLGLFGYGVQRGGDFSRAPAAAVVAATIAHAAASDGVVTGATVVDGVVTVGVVSEY